MGSPSSPIHLTPLDAAFPARLRSMPEPPASITVQGGSVDAACAIAIVGSRRACPGALMFAGELAAAVARAGAVVVSGGALGIDAAAHEGALRSDGRTWAVAGTGHLHCFPPEHPALFERIARGPGAMIWPFAPDFHGRSGFVSRNRVLVALSDAVVVVQARERSGALNAASCAREFGKPLFVVPAAPWMDDFAGSRQLLALGARPLGSVGELLIAMSLGEHEQGHPPLDPGAPDPLPIDLPEAAQAVFDATATHPSHIDSIGARSGLPAQSVSALLLTLALENVVVEGPPGFFRRNNGHKH